ncbi:MAG: DUF86 domain-containing protein [Methanothrix sp.]|jgi:uncharacterized protein YutE (UPF0331/DUF86 family)|nr:DUF86 domain-containing protein [Methanothrix sp.]
MTKKRVLRIELIRSKMADIEESVSLVEANLPSSFDEFSELGLVKDGIYKRMEFAIENIIDILSIINSDLRLSIPEDEEAFIENLGHNGILTQSMVDKIRRMKGFRNIIVHRYGRIDDLLAYKILTEHMDDFSEFIESIERFLEKNQEQSKSLDL